MADQLEQELSNLDEDEYFEQLMDAIHDDFKYYMMYKCEVASPTDPVGLNGWVEVFCPELGSNKNNPLTWIRCMVMQSPRSAVFPKLGDEGVLFFLSANPDQPRFMAETPQDMVAEKPLQQLHTIFKSPVAGSFIEVDEVEGGFEIKSESAGGALSESEPMVLGNKLYEHLDSISKQLESLWGAIQELNKNMNTHTHASSMGPTTPPLPPVSINSSREIGKAIKAVSRIKTEIAKRKTRGQLLSPSNKNN